MIVSLYMHVRLETCAARPSMCEGYRVARYDLVELVGRQCTVAIFFVGQRKPYRLSRACRCDPSSIRRNLPFPCEQGGKVTHEPGHSWQQARKMIRS